MTDRAKLAQENARLRLALDQADTHARAVERALREVAACPRCRTCGRMAEDLLSLTLADGSSDPAGKGNE